MLRVTFEEYLGASGCFFSAGNVSLDWHLTSKVANGCLFLPFFDCTLDYNPLQNTYYLQT